MHRLPLIALALLVALAASHGAVAAAKAPGAKTSRKQPAKPPAEEVAVLETVKGAIVIKLYGQEAPRTVANFKQLIRQGFYDSTYFHRAIPGYLIHGGDPLTRNERLADDGTGGPGYTLPAENRLHHRRGSVSVVALNDSVAHGSHFLITATDQPSLDEPGATVFGEVISPMEVVERIEALGDDPNCPRTEQGPNPAWQALIVRARLEPLGNWAQKPPTGSATP
jgi:cyclophilin family peptidyl-prolyl cis-trans isomerase